MIGTYGDASEDGWVDCKGWSKYVLAPYCAPKLAYDAATGAVDRAKEQASKLARFLRTMAIIGGLGLLGSGIFLGVTMLRQRRARKNPRKKKQGIGNRIARILGGLVLTGLGAIGYAGPQAAEPISTVIGGGMSLSGLYLVGSGVVGPEQANKIRKEIRG